MSDSQNLGTTSSSPADDEIDLGRLFGLLLDHKWWIIGITALFAIAGVAYALLETPVYRADALVQVEKKAGMSNPLEDVKSILGEQPSSDTEVGILRSRMVLGRAVDQQQLTLQVTPHRLPIVGDFLVRHGMQRPAFAEASVWADEYINVSQFQVSQAYIGQPFALTALEDGRYQLSQDGQVLGEGQVGEDASFLDGQVKLRVAELEAGEGATFTLRQASRLAVIHDLRGRFSVSQQGKDSGLLDLSLRDTDQQHAKQVLDALSEVYLTQNIQRQAAEAEKSLEFLEQQAPQVREQLRNAENKLNSYRTQRDSVDLSLETQSILERIVDLEKQLNELSFKESEVSRRFTKSHPTYQALLEKKQQLQNDRDQLEEKVSDLPETQQQVLRMRRDVQVNQEVYVQLLNKIQEMKIARASTVGNVRILDEAAVQSAPVEPKKPLIVVLATLLGGMLSVGLVLLRGFLRRGVESPEQVENAGIPVYATVPLSDEQNKLVKRVKHRKDRSGHTISTDILAERAPADTAIEAVRGLRTSLHFAMLESANNVLAITGPSPGIGKSFITVNLAAVCAQAEQKVLVVDADMRKGHVHHAFGGRSEGGLSELLTGKASLDEVRRTSKVAGLDYIARGSAPPNPSELLMQERFTQFLAEVRQQYDLVVIDTPPILAVTDAAVIGKQCGTTLMVARFQVNPVKELEIAKRRLESTGVPVKGVILNAMEHKAATSYGYGYYSYSYR
ncbi:polysaccharide biosynthesis tyrosine autokinase [Halomonas almeriensis]|uniref:polysaccharide biosynthesis tyrosine autokinase n=1 Tax=Halomonas almeriensis TaxID=308163 RepID=UPI0025B30339|nr:polysaccharide biosynthesis tyrosine autokinase [Halomonas almeriensis]MDN3552587.1 polysaccharide biosynthesis tyrosine autokinase [Halomonas almeriensis]